MVKATGPHCTDMPAALVYIQRAFENIVDTEPAPLCHGDKCMICRKSYTSIPNDLLRGCNLCGLINHDSCLDEMWRTLSGEGKGDEDEAVDPGCVDIIKHVLQECDGSGNDASYLCEPLWRCEALQELCANSCTACRVAIIKLA